MKKLSVILCILLIVSFPITFAANVEDQFRDVEFREGRNIVSDFFSTGREEDLGEAIIVNIKDYQPKLVRESLLEQQDVPVFIQLKGTTLSSIFGVDPITGITMFPPIKRVEIRMNGTNELVSGHPRYIRPNKEDYSLDNLGYLIVNLRKISDKERLRRKGASEGSLSGVVVNEKPKGDVVSGVAGSISEKVGEALGTVDESERTTVSLNMNAKIFFDLEEGRMFGINNQDLMLKEERDSDLFFDKKSKQENSFYSGRGFVRAVQIDDNSAVLAIYNRNYAPVSPFFEGRGIAPSLTGTGMLERNTGVRLTKGEPSRVLNLGDTGDYFRDAFRVRLNEIITPKDRAIVNVIVNGQRYHRVLVVGSKLYQGSGWVVSDINKPVETSINGNEAARKYGINPAKLPMLPDLKEKRMSIVLRNGLGQSKVLESSRLFASGVTIDNMALALEGNQAEVLLKKYCDLKIEVDGEELPNYACESIERYKEVIEIGSGDDVINAYKEIYDILRSYLIYFKGCAVGQRGSVLDPVACDEYRQNMNDLAYYYYNQYLKAGGKPDEELISKMIYRVKAETSYLSDEGITAELDDIELITNAEKGSVSFRIEGNEFKDKHLNDIVPLCGESITCNDTALNNIPYSWRIYGINPNTVVLRKWQGKYKEDFVEENDMAKYYGSEERLVAGDEVVMVYERGFRPPFGSSQEAGPDKQIQVQVTDIQTNNLAIVSILPGSDKAFVESNFKLYIPIDLRPQILTPEQMEKHAEWTRGVIKDLDKIVDKLDNIIRYWKRTCIITFGFLVMKNSFGGGSKAIARKAVMPTYKKVCNKDVVSGVYSSMEECLFTKDKEIVRDVQINERAIEEVNSELDKYNSVAEWRKENVQYDEMGISFEQYREDKRLKLLQKKYEDAGVDTENSLVLKEMKEEYKKQWGMPNIEFAKSDYDEAKTKYGSDRNKFGDVKETDALRNMLRATECEDRGSYGLRNICDDVGSIMQAGDGKYVVSVKEKSGLNNYEVKPLTEYDIMLSENDNDVVKLKSRIKSKLAGRGGSSPTDFQIDEEINNLQKNLYYSEGNGYLYAKTDTLTDGKVDTNTKVFASTVKESIGGPTRNDYADARKIVDGRPEVGIIAQYDEKGRPMCWPIGEGNYIEVIERSSSGKVTSFRVMNVGANGLIDCNGGGDDVFVRGGDETFVQKNPNYQKWKAEINNAPNCKKDGLPVEKVGSILGIGGKKVLCSLDQSKIVNNLMNPSCMDVMDPGDCKILFNACDPVMCPASRCNLGGRYQVPDVIQSGIVGSSVLCLPNIKQGVAVPVCLTGISAGLKNIRSILQGYVDCLETSLAGDAEIGICDYVRSVGMCEFIWKEAIGLFNVRGGIVDWMGEKFTGQETSGGTEYLTFQSSLSNVGNSVNYFTSEYSNTFLASYMSQSTDEVGGQLCRLYVHGKLPSFGEALDQLAEPENPPQFTAFMDEAPYVEGIGDIPPDVARGFGAEQLSLYKVFYHVYAGTGFPQTTSFLGNPSVTGGIHEGPLRVAVFLKEKPELGLTRMYVTTNPRSDGRQYVDVEKGGYVQTTVQTVARNGYDELCIHIQGRDPECGFRKVSTDFGFNELSDLGAKNKAIEKEIDTAEECATESDTTEFGLGAITMPDKMGVFTSGVVRVCSAGIPTDEPSRWSEVGTCGEDKNGKTRGSCWLDKRSLRIKDTGIREDVEKDLLERVKDKVLKNKEVIEILKKLNEERNKLLDQIKELIDKAKKGGSVSVGSAAPAAGSGGSSK